MHSGKRISPNSSTSWGSHSFKLLSIPYFLGISSLATAQDISQDLPGAPSGFSRTGWTPEPMSEMESIIDRLQLRANFSGVYDTNITQGTGTADRPEEEAFILGLGGNFAYQGKGTEWAYSAAYNFNYEQFIGNHSDLSGLNNQGGTAVLRYDAGKVNLSANVGFGVSDGANRYYQDIVKQTTINYGLSGEYSISPKTSLLASLKQQFTEATGTTATDYSTFEGNISAIWKISSLTQIGPGIRYTLISGDDRPDRSTIGPNLNLNYRLSTKVSLRSKIGLDFVEYEDGTSGDPMVSSQIGADYRANSLWGLNASLFRDAKPDQINPGAYDELTSFRLGYYRQIRRVTVNLGAGYELTKREEGGTDNTQPDRDYFTWDASASMPMFSQRVLASIFYKYRDYQNEIGSVDWNSSQVGFSLTTEF